MQQCENCEFFERRPDGRIVLKCNPFTNIKEEACLLKWQLLRIDTMVQAYLATLRIYRRLAPLQEKMFRHMEREVREMDEADSWKYPDEEEQDDDFRGSPDAQ